MISALALAASSQTQKTPKQILELKKPNQKPPKYQHVDKLALRAVQWGILTVLALMPLHAFLSVWLGSITGQQTLIQSWKEITILALVLPGSYLAWSRRSFIKKPLVLTVATFAIVSLIISAISQPGFIPFIFGVKTDLVFIGLFLLAYLSANRQFKYNAAKTFVGSSAIVIAFGMLQAFALPRDFLVNFGYGPDTVVPYQTVAGSEESIRILSTLGGPNQLGAFLILPMCLVLAFLINKPRWWHPLFLIGGLIVQWHTYSRSAWLGLACALIVTLLLALPSRRKLWALGVCILLSASAALWISLNFDRPIVQLHLLHGSTANLNDSTDQHADALQAGLGYAVQKPFGSGLGSAGPASFRSNQPFIPESYFLQLAAEVGFAGLLLFITICLMLARELWHIKNSQVSAAPVLAALAGLSVVNLFLHGWADSSTALTYWAYAGIVVGSKS